jgi:hypothetical protein
MCRMPLPGPRRLAAVLVVAALTAGGCSPGVSGTLPLPPPRPTPSATAPPADPWAEYGVLAERPRGDLDERQRALVAFGDLRAEVTDGGFTQYFAGSAGDHVTEALDAADTAGVPALAAIVRRALRTLGADGPRYPDRTERQALVAALEATGTPFDAVDEEFYALEESTDLDAAMRRLTTAGR